MKKTLLIYLLLILPALFLFSCSKENSELTASESVSIHQTGILDATSPNFHGKLFSKNNWKFADCQRCHASNLDGGITSINCASCHPIVKVHKTMTGIFETASDNFHGKYLLKYSLRQCGQCHGANFTGGSSSPSCSKCHESITVHKIDFQDTTSTNFHGKYISKNGIVDCATCHGAKFSGEKISSPTCITCHPALEIHQRATISDSTSANFHGKFLKTTGWDISKCATCHGDSFTGGTQSPSCNTSGCHTGAQGPAACNTCHGDFNNPSQISPPKDLNGNTSPSSPGVGAHTKHVAAFANGASLACSECHTVPSDVNSAGHLGSDGKAELNFGAFANKSSGAFYNFATNECGNTYCHGNFEFKKSDAGSTTAQLQYTADKMVGNNRSPVWTTSGGSETKCSSCHGIDDTHPSPIGHVPYTIDQCVWCHSSVVDASGTIIDKSKHINGKINVFGTKFSK